MQQTAALRQTMKCRVIQISPDIYPVCNDLYCTSSSRRHVFAKEIWLLPQDEVHEPDDAEMGRSVVFIKEIYNLLRF